MATLTETAPPAVREVFLVPVATANTVTIAYNGKVAPKDFSLAIQPGRSSA